MHERVHEAVGRRIANEAETAEDRRKGREKDTEVELLATADILQHVERARLRAEVSFAGWALGVLDWYECIRPRGTGRMDDTVERPETLVRQPHCAAHGYRV